MFSDVLKSLDTNPATATCPVFPQYLVLTVNVEIFAQYIFLRISRRAVDARKFDVSEKYYYSRRDRINMMCTKIKIREYAP